MSAPVQTIDCRGTAREMGRQYGEQTRDSIRRNLAVFVDPLWNPDEGARFAAAARCVLRDRTPNIFDELVGLAEGADAPMEKIIALNQVDTFGPEWTEECTPTALAGGADGPIMGKNNDGSRPTPFAGPGAERDYVVRRCFPASGIPLLQVTYAGWLSGLDALNAEGLANGHASVGSIFDKSGPRLDIRLQAYHLMTRCRSTSAFIAGMMGASLTGKGFNIAIVDAGGDTVILESAVPLIQCRNRKAPFVYATNHYITPALKDADRRKPAAKPVTVNRLAWLQWTASTRPPTCLPEMKALLSCHEPWAPCRHGGPHLSHTEWSLIALPARREILLAPGAPCSVPYQSFNFG